MKCFKKQLVFGTSLVSVELRLILLQGDLSGFYMLRHYWIIPHHGGLHCFFPSSFSDLSGVIVCDSAISR